MFARISTSLIATLLLLTTATLAAPTQTQCTCEIVSENPSSPTPAPASYTPSAAHWSPADPSQIPVAAVSICTSLGSDLEKLQHTEPELYEAYMRGFTKDAPQKPIPTLDLMSSRGEGRSPARPRRRIVCHAVARPSSSEFQSSFVGLYALQVILVLAVLACVAEIVHLAKQWMESKTASEPICEKSSLRLTGAEKRLLAIPTDVQQASSLFSPGAEKKLRAYETTRYFVTQASSGRREFIAYDDDDDSDDEANRPVM